MGYPGLLSEIGFAFGGLSGAGAAALLEQSRWRLRPLDPRAYIGLVSLFAFVGAREAVLLFGG